MGMYTQTGGVQPVATPQGMMHQQSPQMHQGQQQPPPNSQNSQASLASPLYPWMRSQFGKFCSSFVNYLFELETHLPYVMDKFTTPMRCTKMLLLQTKFKRNSNWIIFSLFQMTSEIVFFRASNARNHSKLIRNR